MRSFRKCAPKAGADNSALRSRKYDYLRGIWVPIDYPGHVRRLVPRRAPREMPVPQAQVALEGFRKRIAGMRESCLTSVTNASIFPAAI
jgi:hypothetical protein